MKIKSLIFLTCIWMSSMAYGSLEQANPHRFYLGPEFLNLQLHTHVDAIRIRSSRFFSGLRFGYEYLKPCAFYVGVDLSGAGSDVDFNASQNNEDLAWQKAERGFGNIELRLGYTYFKCVCKNHDLLMTPFLGLGVYNIFPIDHYHKEGFREDLPYFMGGLRLRYTLCHIMDIGLNAKVLRTVNARQEFQFAGETAKTHQNFWGGEIGVPLIWHIGCSQRWDLQLEPYFLRISDSVYGARTLFGYRF